MYLGLSYLIQGGQISNETVLRYLMGHPVSKVTVAMFFIGMASLGLIASNIFEQFNHERKISFKSVFPRGATDQLESRGSISDSNAEVGPLSPVTVSDRTIELGEQLLDLPKWMHEHYLWQRMVNALHSIYRTNSTTTVEDELKYLADLDLDRQQQRYSLVRILIWATPMLGFLGTVLGISQALGGINVGADNNFQQMMDGLRGSLYIAFDTTALALTLSMILMFVQFLIERFESQLLELVDQRAKQEINSQFDMTVATTEAVYEQMAVDFLDESRKSIEDQTENWRKSIQSAQAAWLSSLGSANAEVQGQLTDALDQSVSNLARSLGEAIDKADNSMAHRWGQWQVTLSENARLMATYQEQLSRQTELIHEMLGQSKTNESLQPVLDQSREAVEATVQLRQTLDELGETLVRLHKPGVPAAAAETDDTTNCESFEFRSATAAESHQKPDTLFVSSNIDSISTVDAGSTSPTQDNQSRPDVILPTQTRKRRIITIQPSFNRNSKRVA